MDDSTIVASPSSVIPLRVRVESANALAQEQIFTTLFRIGRAPDCEVQIPERTISKWHVEVCFEREQWWVRDLQSANGTFLNGHRVQHEALSGTAKLQLGINGPVLWLVVGERLGASPVVTSLSDDPDGSATEIVKRLQWGKGETDGQHTQILREAVKRLTKRKARKYQFALVLVGVLLVGFASYSIHLQSRNDQYKRTAAEIFYSMKQLELQISQLEELVSSTGNTQLMNDLLIKRQQIREMEVRYDQFIDEIGVYGRGMSEQERAIYRIARLFGECEASMPQEFVSEVKKYIQLWKTTDRLLISLRRAQEQGYIPVITSALLGRSLPPQFFFLALQESGFNPQAVGPKTRFGYAKGIWQFMPATAQEYGLRPGPLMHLQAYDAMDERFDFDKATEAAARYLRRLYNTDAQASGLLVMASYNWGEGNVIRMIREMPENPKERNFWQFLQRYKIPQETYDYVFSIVAAAVIADSPKLFGFEFANSFPEFARY